MYIHQAMKEPGLDWILEAIEKEIKDQMENGNFSIVLARPVPKVNIIFPSVRQIKWKCGIETTKFKKHKARLYVDS